MHFCSASQSYLIIPRFDAAQGNVVHRSDLLITGQNLQTSFSKSFCEVNGINHRSRSSAVWAPNQRIRETASFSVPRPPATPAPGPSPLAVLPRGTLQPRRRPRHPSSPLGPEGLFSPRVLTCGWEIRERTGVWSLTCSQPSSELSLNSQKKTAQMPRARPVFRLNQHR